MTRKAILNIVLFIFSYLILLIASLLLLTFCVLAASALVVMKATLITALLGIGLIGMAILTFIFLIKFVFKKKVIHDAPLIEINKQQEPELFELIDDIVRKVNTDSPKRVYISHDVNASVSYNSGFWGILFPARKNLTIGIGLVNSVSIVELKAILAHEFGHFSQRSMKVGTYVHHLNKIVYNMLYENDSFDKMVNNWMSLHLFVSLFIVVAHKITQGFQWILKKLYELVNISYLKLSRQMEFHADAVAAHVAGSDPLITALQRLDLANHSYEHVLNFYEHKVSDAISTENIYPHQLFIMGFLAEKYEWPLINKLPYVNPNDFSRYDQSKLIIEDQWTSHPSRDDRINELKKLAIPAQSTDNNMASTLFSEFDVYQSELTKAIFSAVSYSQPPVFLEEHKFNEEYVISHNKNEFNKFFNGYYDYKVPEFKVVKNSDDPAVAFSDFFKNSKVDLTYQKMAIEKDMHVLREISAGNIKIKSFDYDGVKYPWKENENLIDELASELETVNAKIADNDAEICGFITAVAARKNMQEAFQAKCDDFSNLITDYEGKFDMYLNLINVGSFIHEETPFGIIDDKIAVLKEVEVSFKLEIQNLLNEDADFPELSDELANNFNSYLSKDWIYFDHPEYNNESLQVLHNAMGSFATLISERGQIVKGKFLDYLYTIGSGDFKPEKTS